MSGSSSSELSKEMQRTVREISQRLSLRDPQKVSLERLASVLADVNFSQFVAKPPTRDVATALETINAEHPTVEDFERDFVSLCFALATGVGKTRLMGAFIAYLHSVYSIENFFVLAPNLTIYNKLMGDFSLGNPKYVFKGLSEFSQLQPVLITGENYMQTDWGSQTLFGRIRINVFNISKINSEVRGGKEPKIRRFQEVLGDDYFNYLASLPDLVLLMDESHRYRASAGVRAINELKPALGLELTATPFIESSGGKKTKTFKNVLYDYPLGRAMQDGYVKEPAVVTRSNFSAKNLKANDIEEIKLHDGIFMHEQTKIELQTYAKETGEKLVKPFMLIIARDTTHAAALNELISSDAFFKGQYKDKVIQVDSSTKEDLVIERLLRVEDSNEPTEIVIHVNMLKEGWDVTNLYTIVPLRAANARTLIEQSIGRGLRLPYGHRTGVMAVDRLSIIAHDKFQEIVDEANRPDSLIRLKTIILEDDEVKERSKTVVAEPSINALLGLTDTPVFNMQAASSDSSVPEQENLYEEITTVKPIFETDEEKKIAREVVTELKRVGRQSRDKAVTTQALLEPDIQAKVIENVRRRVAGPSTEKSIEYPDMPQITIEDIVAKTAELMVAKTISIPRILTQPVGDVVVGFEAFTLDLSTFDFREPSKELLVQHLRTNKQERIGFKNVGITEKRLEDYLVYALMEFSDVDYFTQADLLYDLSTQVVDYCRDSLEKADNEIKNMLIVNQKTIAHFIYEQMSQHRYQEATEYETVVSQGFVELKASAFTARADDKVYAVTTPPPKKSEIRKLLYGHFDKCLFPVAKFDSDQERILAGILENESEKWFRPAKGQFQMIYRLDNDPKEYQPDFVVELNDKIVMIEVKAEKDVADVEVQEKARVAQDWCEHASKHAKEHDGKPWHYALIPHTSIQSNMTLNGLIRA